MHKSDCLSPGYYSSYTQPPLNPSLVEGMKTQDHHPKNKWSIKLFTDFCPGQAPLRIWMFLAVREIVGRMVTMTVRTGRITRKNHPRPPPNRHPLGATQAAPQGPISVPTTAMQYARAVGALATTVSLSNTIKLYTKNTSVCTLASRCLQGSTSKQGLKKPGNAHNTMFHSRYWTSCNATCVVTNDSKGCLDPLMGTRTHTGVCTLTPTCHTHTCTAPVEQENDESSSQIVSPR